VQASDRQYVDARLEDVRKLYDTEISTVQRQLAEMSQRLQALEQFKANVLGRAIAISFVGAILVAVSAAVITRLILG
jgi:cell division septum initiation protein DivIVA